MKILWLPLPRQTVKKKKKKKGSAHSLLLEKEEEKKVTNQGDFSEVDKRAIA